MRFLVAALALVPVVANAQALSCRIPSRITVPQVERPAARPTRPGPIRGYTLALSWSPEFCRDNPQDSSEQCDRRSGRFGFILHGLWPEGEGRDSPRWCTPQGALTEAVVRAQFCATPSTRLIAHEWAKHGACAARDPGDYFAAGRKLLASVRIPDMDALSRRQIDVGGFKRVLSAANPAIMPSSLAIAADRKGWLSEVRICLTTTLRPQPCPRNRPRGAPDGAPLKIWRSTP